jgi:hypothetical protein
LSHDRELRFGTEPVIEVMAAFPAALFIECIGPAANFFLKVRVGYYVLRLLLGRFLWHVGHSFCCGAGLGGLTRWGT